MLKEMDCFQSGSLHTEHTIVQRRPYTDIVRAVDQKCVTALVLLDLSAAFDSVDDHVLLSVFERRFAVGVSALSWFRSYLDRRTQVFVVNKRQSVALPVNCSVPQGSVLGFEMFIAYTEDIVSIFSRHQVSHHLFALDKEVYVYFGINDVPSACTRLQDCIREVICWCASRRLQLNASKIELIWSGSRQNLAKLGRGDCSLMVGAATSSDRSNLYVISGCSWTVN
jgi:hypothetical protein